MKLPFLRSTLIPIGTPKRGDILVFIYPEDRSKDFIKRLIGLPGDSIEIRDKKILLNGLPLNDTHGVHVDSLDHSGLDPAQGQFRSQSRSPPDSIFVMGDNRDESYDSRFWGFVKMQDVLGKALIIYWSWNHEDTWVRWGRMGKILN